MMGSLMLAVASGFLAGIVVLASGVGLARARRLRALRIFGVVLLLALVVLALMSGIAFVWLAMLTYASAAGVFTLGASFGAAIGVAVAFVVGLALIAWLLMSSPTRSATGGYGSSGQTPLGRRLGRW